MRLLNGEIGEEIKECGIFNPPRRLLCWNGLETPVERDVTAVAPCHYGFVAVTFDGEMFSHCATIENSKDLKEAKLWLNKSAPINYCPMCERKL